MSTFAWRALRAPAAVAMITVLCAAFGDGALALVVLALGASALIAFHLFHLHRLDAWARAARDSDVPEGHGVWAAPLASIHRRVRARNAYERDLRQTIERFRQAAAALPDGIVVLDAAHRIDWANTRALAQLGLDLAKDRGQPIVNLVRQPEFRRYVASGDYAAPVVVESDREAGRTLALQLVPFADDQNLVLSRDITGMEAVARVRRDFIASVSHELKTPLTVISGFIETLQDVDVDARERARFLHLMQAQATSMQHLVADLLTLSALETDQSPVHEERFAIVPVVTALSSDAEALSNGAHRIDVDVAGPATILGSREEIASAFGNLVSNAVRYTPAGGAIALAWHVDADGTGVFAVSDNGIGIAAEHLPRLTERFYRVDRSRSRATGGTGLGLAIVKHVLLRHQGELAIVSERGKGSTFTVRLPAQRVQRDARARRAAIVRPVPPDSP
jgi:two-component system, OmpR family, phosphate regulon sensor histidine kinase PhoR